MKKLSLITILAFSAILALGGLTFAEQKGGQNYVKLSKVIGETIHNQQGKEIGEVKDVVVSQGNVEYLIVSPKGEDKLVPVPVEAANLHMEGDKVVTQLSENQLASAPSFNESEWPNFSQSYDQKVNAYYGAPMRQPGKMPSMQHGPSSPGRPQ